MNIHVKEGGLTLGGSFRRPLAGGSEFVISNVTEGLKEIFEVEDGL